jgi:hypothetical protein
MQSLCNCHLFSDSPEIMGVAKRNEFKGMLSGTSLCIWSAATEAELKEMIGPLWRQQTKYKVLIMYLWSRYHVSLRYASVHTYTHLISQTTAERQLKRYLHAWG